MFWFGRGGCCGCVDDASSGEKRGCDKIDRYHVYVVCVCNAGVLQLRLVLRVLRVGLCLQLGPLRRFGLGLRLPQRRIHQTRAPAKAKQIRSNLAHLDLLAALGDAVPTVVAPDVLKRIMSRIAVSAMDLDGLVGGLRAQSVGVVIAHAHFVADAVLDVLMGHGVHFQRGFADQETQHFALGGEFDEGELDALVVAEGRAEGAACVGVGDGLLDAVYGGPERGGCLADAVLVHEGLGDAEAVVDWAEGGGGGDPDVLERDGGVVGGHVEGPGRC